MKETPEASERRADPAGNGNGYPLRDEATQPFPPPAPPPSEAVAEGEFSAVGPAAPAPPRRRFVPGANPWPWLIAVILLLGGLGVAYGVTRPGSSHHAGTTPPAPAPPAPAPTPPATTPPPTTAKKQPSQPVTAAVPSLVGSTLPHAVSALKQAGLTALVTHIASNAPEGQVVAQRPTAGAKLPPGGKVQLSVAVQPLVVVPNVTGVRGLTAVHELEADHLTASIKYVPSTQPARRVISQFPPAGRKVRRGTSVLINESQGNKAKATVPDVVGEDEQTATSDLQAAGFKVDSVDASTSDPSKDGTVLYQSPNGGGTASKGATVTIHVARYSGG